jgi:hypothetical protein
LNVAEIQPDNVPLPKLKSVDQKNERLYQHKVLHLTPEKSPEATLARKE